ncbi:hypothetical protein [Spongiibacter sp.]|uniref:hypothetical protein n=1 Tax=Spongiibacter sp. TaxID=2024860 RepID=UPI00356867DA
MNSTPSLLVPLPEINRHQHSLFPLSAAAVGKWLETLPLANLGETTRSLYQALNELSHVRCKGRDRLDILEKIRPHVHYITKGLSQHYLNKPIVLPEKAEKIVQLTDTLNTLLALGYCQAFVNLEVESRLLKPKDALATCLHRALTEYSCMLLRSYQLYRTPPRRFWRNLHHIYHSVQTQKLSRLRVSDRQQGSCTLQQAYLRPLILACSRCYQLPQRYIDQVFLGLRYWTEEMELRHKGLESCVFLLDPDQDAPPLYRELASKAPAPGWLGIDTKALQGGSASLLNLIPDSKLSTEFRVPEAILGQLSMAWSAATARAAERVPCNEAALITVGMNPTHYYAANQAEFEQFQIEGDDAASRPDPYSAADNKPKSDVWAQGKSRDGRDYDRKSERDTQWGTHRGENNDVENIDYSLPADQNGTSKVDTQYQYLRARLMDSSSAGYRIEWPDTVASRIRTGEVIGVKTSDYESWRIAVVRWMRSDDSHQMGVEVIASAATAYSARLVQSGLAVDEFQRALLLPGGDKDSGPLVMLASVASLTPGQTVELVRPGHVMRIKLDEIRDSSNSYKLFSYQDLRRQQKIPTEQVIAERDEGDSDFNKLWDIL